MDELITEARRTALEEAAQICEGVNNYDNPMTANDCADAIRALPGSRLDVYPNDVKLMIAIHAYAKTASEIGLYAAFQSKQYKELAKIMQIRYPNRLPDGWRR